MSILRSKSNTFMEYYSDYKNADTWGKIKPYISTKWQLYREQCKSGVMTIYAEIKHIIKFIKGFHRNMKVEYTPLPSTNEFNLILSDNTEVMETIYISEEKILTPYGHFRFRFDKHNFNSNYKLHDALQTHFSIQFAYKTVEILGCVYILFPIRNPIYIFPSYAHIKKYLI